MFKNPFSFSGRIRRTEFGLSYIIYVSVFGLMGFFTALLTTRGIIAGPGSSGLMGLIAIPAVWFLLAQGAKRCHDRGNSGFYQLIPLYVLWMIFAAGEEGTNEFGPDPKAEPEFDFLTEQEV